MSPAVLINIMSKLNFLNIACTHIKDQYSYCNYRCQNILQYIITILYYIDIKALYIILHEDKMYLSPLNIQHFRGDLTYDVYGNDDLKEMFSYDGENPVVINANEYDIIIITGAHTTFISNMDKNIPVILENFDIQNHYKSSILLTRNREDFSYEKTTSHASKRSKKVPQDVATKIMTEAHAISLSQCNNLTVVNTTAQPFYEYTLEDFIPGKDTYYYMKPNSKLTKPDYILTEIPATKDITRYPQVYTSALSKNLSLEITNVDYHFFTAKSGSLRGGVPSLKKPIPSESICKNIFFPNNIGGFCWFSVIINSFFYADDISIIFLNKVMHHMDNALAHIEAFNYILRICKDIYTHPDKMDAFVSAESEQVQRKMFIDELKKFYDEKDDIGITHLFVKKKCENIFANDTIEMDDKHWENIIIHLVHLFTFIYCSFTVLRKNQIKQIEDLDGWMRIYNLIMTEKNYKHIAEYIMNLSKIS